MKDFIVNISKLTKPLSQQGFGLPLILATSKVHAYTLYSDIAAVAEDFAVDTDEYKLAARMFGQNPAPSQIAIYGVLTAVPAELVTALNTLILSNNDWYFLVCPENADAVITALAAWADTQIKMYFATTQNEALPATLENENAVVMYHNTATAYVAEGLAAIAAVNKPGSLTFKFRTVNGVLEADLNDTELTQLHTDGGFSYVKKMGILQTSEGITTTGEYIDVVMGAHFLKVRMEEGAMMLAVKNKKIPYDNSGIAMLVGVADSVLKQGVTQGIIMKDGDGKGVYEITYVKREDVSDTDVANRAYNGVQWSAKLAGAIHTGTISGVLTY
jgi:hypothetical protein